jgi:hypothetical protein
MFCWACQSQRVWVLQVTDYANFFAANYPATAKAIALLVQRMPTSEVVESAEHF